MKIVDIYEDLNIQDMTADFPAASRKGHKVFIDYESDQEYHFCENGMIRVYPYPLSPENYQLNLRVSEDDRSSILIHGLARQMKFALPRILARRTNG